MRQTKIKINQHLKMNFGSLSLIIVVLLSACNITQSKNATDATESESESKTGQASLISERDTELTDKDITYAINREFIIQDGVDANAIEASTELGIVTLEGEVDDLLAKQRATKVARMVKGVRGVVNLLAIQDTHKTDQEIKSDIEDAWLMDAATESYELDVRINDGVATLTGNVESWQEKELAEKVAKGVSGVREIINEIEYEFDANRADPEIKKEIEQALKWDTRIDDELINVSVENNVVTLDGTAGSATEKNLAYNTAWVAGVKHVDTEDLKVNPVFKDEDLDKKQFEDLSDGEIKQAIVDAFIYDPRVYSFNPQVDVNDGLVTLTGHVDNLQAKKAAENDAKNINGVWKVDNFLKVRPPEVYKDTEIAEDIRQAFYRNPSLEQFEIDVSVFGGTAYLEGSVDNFYEKYHAEELASTVNGVTEIKNKIEVNSGAMPYAFDYDYFIYSPYWTEQNYGNSPRKSDIEIANDIQNQIFWSSQVDAPDVRISVNKGIATLNGEVDTWNEKYFAEKNAYEGGAIYVENNIDVE